MKKILIIDAISDNKGPKLTNEPMNMERILYSSRYGRAHNADIFYITSDKDVAKINDISEAFGAKVLVTNATALNTTRAFIESIKSPTQFIISTDEMSLASLISPNVTALSHEDGVIIGESELRSALGVKPSQVLNLIALSSNGTGVGPKKAAELLSEFDTLAGIFHHFKSASGFIANALNSNRNTILKTRVALDPDHSDWKVIPSNTTTISYEEIYKIYQKHGLSKWIPYQHRPKYDNDADCLTISIDHVRIIETTKQLNDLRVEVEGLRKIAIKAELSSEGHLLGVAMAISPSVVCFIPLDDCMRSSSATITKRDFSSAFKELLENESLSKISYKSKESYRALGKIGIDLRGLKSDCESIAFFIDNRTKGSDLALIASNNLGIDCSGWIDEKPLSLISGELKNKVISTAAEAIHVAWHVNHFMYRKLSGIDGAVKLYNDVDLPFIKTISKLENYGIHLSKTKLIKLGEDIDKKITENNKLIESKIGAIEGLASKDIISKILQKTENISVDQVTKMSLSESSLLGVSKSNKLILAYIRNGQLSRLKANNVDKLLIEMDDDGIIYPTYNITNTITSRLSSKDPNIQATPIKTDEGKVLRKAFDGRRSRKIIAADYSQIELRILSYLSQDKVLIEAFRSGADIHSSTASQIFNTPLDQVTSDQRRSAKAINFGIIYGMTAHGLSKDIGCSVDTAGNYINAYFAKYPGVKKYVDNAKRTGLSKGFVETALGRKLYLPNETRSKNEKRAVNFPMQGTASDIIKKAMIQIDSAFQEGDMKSQMIMQVHDEIVVEVEPGEEVRCLEIMKSTMEQSFNLGLVALDVDLECGESWGGDSVIDPTKDHEANMINMDRN